MIKYLNKTLVISGVVFLLAGTSCTKLDTPPQSELTEDIFPKTDKDFIALSGTVYTPMRSYTENVWNPQEAGTDEMLAPTRGSDWGDGGKWKNMHYHEFNSSIDLFNGAWTWGFGAIATTNQVIGIVSGTAASPARDKALAELKTMRAFYYFCMMDMFGNLPIVTEGTKEANPPQKTREEVFNFIESELKAAMPSLSSNVNVATYGRPTIYVADMILAKLYLNAPVYINSVKLNEADAVLTEIVSSDKFTLLSNSLDMFRPNNGYDNGDGSLMKEGIFAIPFDATYARGANHFTIRTLHGANRATFNLPYDPWNGFATTADFYDTYSATDARSKQWLVGPQKSASGAQLFDGNYPIVFTKTFAKPTDYNQGGDGPGRSSGVRNIKYYPDANAGGDFTANNDYLVFRFSDAVLMKAEVELRKGGLSAGTLSLVNAIHTRAGLPAYTSLDLNELYKERGREFSWEGWRRNDMIRFGHWEDSFGFNPGTAGQTYKRIFPIPSSQLAINSGLKQNTGY